MKRTRGWRLVLSIGGVGAALLIGAGCESTSSTASLAGGPDRGGVVRPGPVYQDVATAYNRRVEQLDRVFARANLSITYFDEHGERQKEDPEGRLQVVRPDRLALSLGKAGQTLFWFGCDPAQYWWFDLSDNSRRIAAVGRHDRFDQSASRRIGLAVRPLDLIGVLGITPLDTAGPGATQWSEDGTLIGITTPIARRGWQRLWVDPKTYVPRTIEIFDQQRQLVLIADHEGLEAVEQTRTGSGGRAPQISGRITASHVDSGTDIRLTLTGARDGPISDKAFDLPTLLEKYSVEEVIDLDRPARARPSATPSAPKP